MPSRYSTKPVLLPVEFEALQPTLEGLQREMILSIERGAIHVTVTTTTYTVGDESVIYVDDDTAGGDVTITLPPVALSNDRLLYFKKIGSTGDMILDGEGSETIDGATTRTVSPQWDADLLHCNGSAWFVL